MQSSVRPLYCPASLKVADVRGMHMLHCKGAFTEHTGQQSIATVTVWQVLLKSCYTGSSTVQHRMLLGLTSKARHGLVHFALQRHEVQPQKDNAKA
jgi:hypothetical protein